MRSPAASLFAAALVAVTMLIAAAPSHAAVPRAFWGVVPQTPLGSTDFARMGQAKVGTLRILVSWNTVSPTAAGQYDWGGLDAVVGGAAQNGVEVLPFLYGTPDWVAAGLDGHACAGNCATFAPKSQAALDAWSAFVGEAVDRYGPSGSFWTENPTIPKVPITAWQIWNEQNSSTFYAPKPNPSTYANLLGAAHDAIATRDPSADVVLGGMADLAGSSKAVRGSKYLAKLYKVSGVKADFDGVAPHPYGATVEKVASQIDLYRKVMKKAHDKGADLWITEIGWGSKSGGNPLNRGTKGQAQELTDAFKYFKKNRNALNIANVDWFSWMDSKSKICSWCSSSGLFKSGLKAKPSLKAFTKFTGGS
jgi:hypothetical protein